MIGRKNTKKVSTKKTSICFLGTDFTDYTDIVDVCTHLKPCQSVKSVPKHEKNQYHLY